MICTSFTFAKLASCKVHVTENVRKGECVYTFSRTSECKLGWPLQGDLESYANYLKTHMPFVSTIPLVGIYPKTIMSMHQVLLAKTSIVTSKSAERQISNHRECNTPTPCDSVIKYYLKAIWNLIWNNIIIYFYVRKAGFNTVCAMWFLKFFWWVLRVLIYARMKERL